MDLRENIVVHLHYSKHINPCCLWLKHVFSESPDITCCLRPSRCALKAHRSAARMPAVSTRNSLRFALPSKDDGNIRALITKRPSVEAEAQRLRSRRSCGAIGGRSPGFITPDPGWEGLLALLQGGSPAGGRC